MCVSAMRVATVEEIVGGARVRLQYRGTEVGGQCCTVYAVDLIVVPGVVRYVTPSVNFFAWYTHLLCLQVENDDFWCHQNSPLIHPVGWSQLVGHKLHASAGDGTYCSIYGNIVVHQALMKVYLCSNTHFCSAHIAVYVH